MRLAWEACLLAISALLAWFLFLRQPSVAAVPAAPQAMPTPLRVAPRRLPEAHANESAARTPTVTEAVAALPREPMDPTPPPAELGEPDGDQEASQQTESPTAATFDPADAQAEVQGLMRNASLQSKAEAELSGKTRQGFATVLSARPEDQFAIARFFGEPIVLVPRSAIDPTNPDPSYFRLDDNGSISELPGRPALEQHRQYRDFFDYEYSRLPEPIRELRRMRMAREQVFLFAALISPAEWALVIARREAARQLAPDPDQPVQRYELRYQALSGGGFDLVVERIVFADGSRFRPSRQPE